jgi:hypothetical protein
MNIKEAREILVRFNEWIKLFGHGYSTDLVSAIDTVVSDGWILLKDTKPELYQECIIFNGVVLSGFVYNRLGSFDDNGEGLYCIVDATHWMPLPEAPKK